MNTNLFKQMFSEYCKNEIKNGHCDEYDCEFCCINQAWNKIFEQPKGYSFYIVELIDDENSTYCIAIKATHEPTFDEVREFLKDDIESSGFHTVNDVWETDEDEVFGNYYTDDIDSWSVLGE